MCVVPTRRVTHEFDLCVRELVLTHTHNSSRETRGRMSCRAHERVARWTQRTFLHSVLVQVVFSQETCLLRPSISVSEATQGPGALDVVRCREDAAPRAGDARRPPGDAARVPEASDTERLPRGRCGLSERLHVSLPTTRGKKTDASEQPETQGSGDLVCFCRVVRTLPAHLCCWVLNFKSAVLFLKSLCGPLANLRWKYTVHQESAGLHLRVRQSRENSIK